MSVVPPCRLIRLPRVTLKRAAEFDTLLTVEVQEQDPCPSPRNVWIAIGFQVEMLSRTRNLSTSLLTLFERVEGGGGVGREQQPGGGWLFVTIASPHGFLVGIEVRWGAPSYDYDYDLVFNWMSPQISPTSDVYRQSSTSSPHSVRPSSYGRHPSPVLRPQWTFGSSLLTVRFDYVLDNLKRLLLVVVGLCYQIAILCVVRFLAGGVWHAPASSLPHMVTGPFAVVQCGSGFSGLGIFLADLWSQSKANLFLHLSYFLFFFSLGMKMRLCTSSQSTIHKPARNSTGPMRVIRAGFFDSGEKWMVVSVGG
ncbi:hypothetical protein G7K_2301-t1 [Saitoella complicata NRRL Y-17804]|uniref:Uncharacterized protein n=1 Tax=Saitoella complicata (strain BCRC 22490 / CBS 7301 / JCM 7358 / NBRC 10748 / NRRL Y-17804) TaxID=698492 RepID=A0A0E9NE38_SAICN|nr:hypothetical protein G7K_2301-t1 [Saitoella complicata NRRL Y-17804]